MPDVLHRYRHAAIVLCFATSIALAKLADLDDHLWYQWHDLTTSAELREGALWLPRYKALGLGSSIPGVVEEASGITYDSDTDSLWVLANKPYQLLQLDRELQLRRSIDLVNFLDAEAVVYLGNGRFAIADERAQALVMADITPATRSLDKNSLPQLSVKLGPKGNNGLEGMAYDKEGDMLFAVRERKPRALAQIEGLQHTPDNIVIDADPAIDVDKLYLSDLSGLHFDQKSGNLLMLSHESMLLAEIDLQGNRISFMDLKAGFNNQESDILQAEGVTLDDNQILYIVSEPNLVYRFQRAP